MNWKLSSPNPKAVDAWWHDKGKKPARYIRLKDRRVIAYRLDGDTLAVIFRSLYKADRRIVDTAIRLSYEAIDALQILKNKL